jgi:hypothetical protein
LNLNLRDVGEISVVRENNCVRNDRGEGGAPWSARLGHVTVQPL